jgi:hypothetical protein
MKLPFENFKDFIYNQLLFDIWQIVCIFVQIIYDE